LRGLRAAAGAAQNRPIPDRRSRIAAWTSRNVAAGGRSGADILVCGFWGLSSPQFIPARKFTELESSVNPQAGKPALRAGVLLGRREQRARPARIGAVHEMVEFPSCSWAGSIGGGLKGRCKYSLTCRHGRRIPRGGRRLDRRLQAAVAAGAGVAAVPGGPERGNAEGRMQNEGRSQNIG